MILRHWSFTNPLATASLLGSADDTHTRNIMSFQSISNCIVLWWMTYCLILTTCVLVHAVYDPGYQWFAAAQHGCQKDGQPGINDVIDCEGGTSSVVYCQGGINGDDYTPCNADTHGDLLMLLHPGYMMSGLSCFNHSQELACGQLRVCLPVR